MKNINHESKSVGSFLSSNLRQYSMIMMLALIMIVFAFFTNGVNLNSRNISNILIQNSYILILAVGMLLIIILGNIDLSVGSVLAFVGALSAMLYNLGIGMFLTVVLSIIIGLLIGVFQGFWIAYLKIPAFIVTLAGLSLFRGLTYIITNVTPIALKDDGFKQLASGTADIPSLVKTYESFNKAGIKIQLDVHYTAVLVAIVFIVAVVIAEFITRRKKVKNGFEVLPMSLVIVKLIVISAFIAFLGWKFATYRGIPTVAIVLGVTIAVFTFLMKNTILGRYIYAVGGNARSAKLSGINSELVVFIVHIIMGGLCGLAAVIFTGYMNTALPQAGQSFELDAVASCFIGGAATTGGIGTIIGAIIGGLVMAAINNGMSLMNIAAQWQYVVKATVLLLAVLYDIYTRRKSGLG